MDHLNLTDFKREVILGWRWAARELEDVFGLAEMPIKLHAGATCERGDLGRVRLVCRIAYTPLQAQATSA